MRSNHLAMGMLVSYSKTRTFATKMKKLFVLLAFVAVVASSCSKDGDGTPVLINPNAKLSCSLDGSPWTAITRVTTNTQGTFVVNTRVTTNTQGTFVVNGSALQSDALNITIIGETTGTYTLGTGQYNFSASYSPVASNTDSLYTAINGTVELTDVDTQNRKISGTFSFNAVNVKDLSKTISVTNGVFTSLSYN